MGLKTSQKPTAISATLLCLSALLLLLPASANCTGEDKEGCSDCIRYQLSCACPGCRHFLRCIAGCLWNGTTEGKCVKACDSPRGGGGGRNSSAADRCKKCMGHCKCSCLSLELD